MRLRIVARALILLMVALGAMAEERDGMLAPPTIGQFRNGRGEFYGRGL